VGTLAMGSPWVERRQGGLAVVESRVGGHGVRGAQGEESGRAWCGGVVVRASLYRFGEEGRRLARRRTVN
jgi:hypothetical protein